jgi:hypothetical protein
MPRYFFNVFNGLTSPDLDGSDLADLGTAKLEAIKMTGAILADSSDGFADGRPWRMEILNQDGKILITIRVTIETSPVVLAG